MAAEANLEGLEVNQEGNLGSAEIMGVMVAMEVGERAVGWEECTVAWEAGVGVGVRVEEEGVEMEE